MSEREKLADELERLGDAYSAVLMPGEDAYASADEWCMAALPLLRAAHRNLPTILSALRADSDEAVERAAGEMAENVWLGQDVPWRLDLEEARPLARAALRAALEPQP